MNRILVGVSGAATSYPAIAWATEFASPSHTPVELVHVVDITWGLPAPDFIAEALLRAEDELRGEVEKATAAHPTVPITSYTACGSPVSELVARGEDADLIVVGAHPKRHRGRAGSKPVRIAGLAACSVVVVPSDLRSTASGVVVGVDGSEDSAAAVTFGAAMADRYGETLTVVHAWDDPEPWGMVEPMLVPTEPADEDRIVLAEAIGGLATMYPDLQIRSEVISSPAVTALYSASIGARLVVVGSRGRHGVAKALLGSVSEELVAVLPCPVAVIRP